MLNAWRDDEPHTIWEAYSPAEAKPSTHKRPDRLARPDFCGWSALGPISLMIENLLGFDCNAQEKTVSWRIHHSCRHGIRNLRFGNVQASLIYNGRGTIDVTSNGDFILAVGNKQYPITSGQTRLKPEI